MIRIREIKLDIDHSEAELRAAIASKLGVGEDAILRFDIRKRSVDARHNAVYFIYIADVCVSDEEKILLIKGSDPHISLAGKEEYELLNPACKATQRPLVIGSGPCGLFCALLLSELGLEPVVLERGRIVNERCGDVNRFWDDGKLDSESNAMFGEGGAGTFSDGKLTTQIRDKNFRSLKVVSEMVEAGALEEIMFVNKPHIGTDNLVRFVANIRRKILSLGGEYQFQSKVADIEIQNGKAVGVKLADGREIRSDHIVLAIGHSARDTFEMLKSRAVSMAAKKFSVGVRIEHPQSVIDSAMFGKFAGHPKLGSADYKLVHHCKNGRSVYSFCMCPGGEVIGCSSADGEVVTNGMSRYSRSGVNANSALLAGVGPEDFESTDPLAGVEFQRRWERKAFELGGKDYCAPVQLVGDFLKGKESREAGVVIPSYMPSVKFADMRQCLPKYVCDSLKEALVEFGRKIAGFSMHDGILTGVETRSSSPVRILRNEDMQSVNVGGLYPAGEGAGYAGGIISSAVDGIKAAEAIARSVTNQ